MKRFLHLAVIIFFVSHLSLLISACTQDAYDKGEGKYSLMRADFVEAHANAQKEIDYITTDDGERLSTTTPLTAKWVTTADSTYRCVLYYNKVEDESGRLAAEPLSIGKVPCLTVIPLSKMDKEMKTDPVKLESTWMSKTGKYLNLSFYLKTGTADDEKATQTVSLVCDTIMANPDATRTGYLRLFHDQGGIPEYYSTQVLASIITKDIDADSIRISINTYQGEVVKTFKATSGND